MMNAAQIAPSVLWLVPGQSEQRINDVAERFQSGGSEFSATHLIVFAVVIVIVGLVLWRVARVIALREGRSYFSSKRLFLDLCRLHELDLPSRRLLQRLAQARGLQHPGRLFLEPALFNTAEIPSPLRPYREQLAEIRERLFHDAENAAG